MYSKKRGLCVVRAVFQAGPDLTAKIVPWLGSRMRKSMLRLASDCSAGRGDSVAVVSRIAASQGWHCGQGVGGYSSLRSLPSASQGERSVHSLAKSIAVWGYCWPSPVGYCPPRFPLGVVQSPSVFCDKDKDIYFGNWNCLS